MQREEEVADAEAKYQVVLLGGDGEFSGIGAVQVWRNELESDAGVLHDLVEHLKERRKTTVGEVSVEGGVRANKFVLAARVEWLCNDGITIIVVEDHEVFAAATGSDGETTCLVRGDLAGDSNGLQECHFGSGAGLWGWNIRRRHLWRIVVYGRGGGDIG